MSQIFPLTYHSQFVYLSSFSRGGGVDQFGSSVGMLGEKSPTSHEKET